MTGSLAPAILRYVPHPEINRYLQEGWTITYDLSDCCHGRRRKVHGQADRG
jgi:hypothetical protein